MGFECKTFKVLAASLVLLACISGCLDYPGNAYADELGPTDEKLLATMMEERGMAEMVGAEALLDRHGEPSYALGRSSDGYIIIHRATGAFMEQGAGTGPYTDLAISKYYGGLLCYTEETDRGLVNPVNGEIVGTIPYCPSAEAYVESVARSQPRMSDDARPRTRSSTVVESGQVALQGSKIKRVAFGLNADGDYPAINNSCTAVALTIALNYLDYSFDDNLVDANMELETLVSTGYLGGYARATNFHSHLVNDCGLGPGIFGIFGPSVVDGVGEYLGETQARSDVDLGFDWTIINTGWIEGSINKNVPALITTTFSTWEGGTYNTHTMVAYGYRRFGNGTEEINLHSGWYDSHIVGDSITSNYYMGDLWAPSGVADMTYRFELSDGWHCSGAGNWKYYDDEAPVTGRQTIGGNVYYFDEDGVLISQAPVSSPFTGPSGGEEPDALQVAYQERLQRTAPGRIPGALARAMAANPDVIAWLRVPGTSVSVPVARREGDAGYYLSHDSLGNESPIGCAFTSGDGSFGDAVTVVYGHSFSSGDLAFTSLRVFWDYEFFRGHDEVWLYLPGRRVEYCVVGANLFTARAIEGVDQSDPVDLASYFAELGDPDPASFVGYKRNVRLDPGRDRVLQLSTCTVPADPARRFVVTCVLVGEEGL